MNESYISSQKLDLNPCPIHSSEGLISNLKDDNLFIKLWNEKIYKIGLELKMWYGHDDAQNFLVKDFNDFRKARKKDKTIDANKYIQYLLNNVYITDPEKRKDVENNKVLSELKQAVGENVYNLLKNRAKNMAVEINKLHTISYNGIKSDNNIKQFFQKHKINDYMNCVIKPDKIESIEMSILIETYNYNIKSNKENPSKIKMDYNCYLVDMYKLRCERSEDLYDEVGEELYDIFDNYIPTKTTNSNLGVDDACLGWESIAFNVWEK